MEKYKVRAIEYSVLLFIICFSVSVTTFALGYTGIRGKYTNIYKLGFFNFEMKNEYRVAYAKDQVVDVYSYQQWRCDSGSSWSYTEVTENHSDPWASYQRVKGTLYRAGLGGGTWYLNTRVKCTPTASDAYQESNSWPTFTTWLVDNRDNVAW